MKKQLIFLAGFMAICRIVTAQPVMVERYEFEKLQSRLEFSQNRKFVFAIVPKMSISDYEREVGRELLAAGRSEKEVAKFKTSARYREALNIERGSRMRYPETGFYNAVSGLLVKRFPDFPTDCEQIFVSDFGEYFVAVNVHVLLGIPLEAETPMSQLRKTPQVGIYVGWTDLHSESCRLPLSVLVDDSDRPSISTVGFKWASDDVSFEDAAKTISLRKLNDEPVRFDIDTCELDARDNVSSIPKELPRSCWLSFLIAIGLFGGLWNSKRQ